MPAGKAIKSIWIMGCGKFGRLAALRLARRFGTGQILMVDNDPRPLEDLPYHRIQADAAQWLAEELHPLHAPDMIVPAVPIHLAYHWMANKLAPIHTLTAIPVPPAIRSALPGVFDGGPGQIYFSNATFLCPDNCPEPKNRCPVTGIARPRELFRHLQTLDGRPLPCIVIRSFQLAPGVGGYPPRALFRALEAVQRCRDPILLSTACRCHGVANVFQIAPKEEGGSRLISRSS